jgi:DNA-directed RNA polymerase subunit RPC12/RpoP
MECDRCGGWLVEDIQTGEMQCDTCHIRILPDGSVDESYCEDE